MSYDKKVTITWKILSFYRSSSNLAENQLNFQYLHRTKGPYFQQLRPLLYHLYIIQKYLAVGRRRNEGHLPGEIAISLIEDFTPSFSGTMSLHKTLEFIINLNTNTL